MLEATGFGEDFHWGVSSSAYQTEGAYLEDGKGYSIWDEFTLRKGKIAGGQHAQTATNFYHRYIQDLILMQYLNIRNFRFSIAWSRVLPQGVGGINEKGIEYYDRLIDYALELGIQPWVTLYHWDLPLALELKGGWTNRDIIYWFEEYVQLCLKRFADRVQHWMVLNEPIVFTGAGYFLGLHAPGRKGLSSFLAAVHHAVLCQALGGKMIQEWHGGLKAGTTFSCSPVDPVDNSRLHVEAAQRVDVLMNRLFVEPLIGLGYPTEDLKVLQQIEKFMKDGDEQKMQHRMDFIGLQNYTREVVQHSAIMPYVNARLIKAGKRNVARTAMDWEIYPEGIYQVLKRFGNYEHIPSIIITENGAAFPDEVHEGQVNDLARIQFYQQYLQQVLKAKNEGVKVDGYFAWSFTDNFEWAEGYRPRFGLVYVDYPTQKRIIKASGYWFRDFLAQTIPNRAVAV
jgi:beta-glucosidase